MAPVKLLMTWDILPGREEDYFEFHVRKFVPSLERLGLTLSEAWLTVHGDQPRLMAEAIMPSLASARKVLHSDEWEELGFEMEDFVENFSSRVVKARRGFQL